MYGGILVGGTAAVSASIVGLVGTAALMEAAGGSALVAGTAVGTMGAIVAAPIAVIGGSIYLIAKSSWKREKGIEEAEKLIKKGIFDSSP